MRFFPIHRAACPDSPQVHNKQLLQTLLKYIQFRKSLSNPDASQVVQLKEEDSQSVDGRTPTPLSTTSLTQKPPPTTSPSLLSQIAWLAEEVVRASDEKVNVAKTAYESVSHKSDFENKHSCCIDQADRQIRFLDFAIQEQETSLTLGLRPGTNPLHTLCGTVVQRYIRPQVEGTADHFAQDDGIPILGVVDPDTTPNPIVKRKHRKSTGGGRRRVTARTASGALKVMIPPLVSFAGPPPEAEIDPNEPRYCYCHQVSFGEVSRFVFSCLRWF